MRRFPSRLSAAAGFSLVELSVVMAILSVIAVLGLETAAAFMSRTAYQTTQERLAAIKTALSEYRAVYGYLPCPASTSASIASTSYGIEQRSSGTCNASVFSTSIYYGDVPIRNLNLPIHYLKDGYGARFSYVVTGALAASAANSFNNGTALITVRTGKIEQPCSSICQNIATGTSAAAYVVLSHGIDKRSRETYCTGGSALYDSMIDSVNCRFGSGETLRTLGSGAIAAVPADVFYDSRYNTGSVEETHFDDLIIWQTKAQL